jgi:hypothetical protein
MVFLHGLALLGLLAKVKSLSSLTPIWAKAAGNWLQRST